MAQARSRTKNSPNDKSQGLKRRMATGSSSHGQGKHPNMSDIVFASPGPLPQLSLTTVQTKCCKNIEYYRGIIKNYIERLDYESAAYWAEKVVSLSSGSQQDVYTLAKCMFLCGQYHRAANYLHFHKYERSNLYFRCLMAKCLYMAREFHKALDILDLDNRNVQPGQKVRESKWEPADPQKTIIGQIYLLRGKIYEALMNRILATENYKEALQQDIYCHEAFQLLTQHQMLSRAEEVELLQSLPFAQACLNNDTEFVKYLYTSQVKKYPTCGDLPEMSPFPAMRKNLDVLTGDAERHFYNCDFQKAHQVASQVIAEDPYHTACLPVLIACQVELKKATDLFKTAHKLIEVMSESALSWYSVGAYYFLIGKHESARRNLNKALSIDPVYGPAWLLFGHSFATESEHDQAMAAYFKATQLMKGCHLPMLHVGLECGLSNNPQLALKFLEEAKLLAPRDPFIIHEMGVVKFYEKKFHDALYLFLETVSIIERQKPTNCPNKWESLYNNLGHCCRKIHRYDEAYQYHQKALVLCPNNASTYAAIGLVHAVSGRAESAVESFHKALSLRRDDAFSNTMLRYVVEKMVEDANENSSDEEVLPSEEETDDEDEQPLFRKKPVPVSTKTRQSEPDGMDPKPESSKNFAKTPKSNTYYQKPTVSWYQSSVQKFIANCTGGSRLTSTPASSSALSFGLNNVDEDDRSRNSENEDDYDSRYVTRFRPGLPDFPLLDESSSSGESDKTNLTTSSSDHEGDID